MPSTTSRSPATACSSFALATAANVNDTWAFERLFLAAFDVMARIQIVFSDKGYDAEANRDLCSPLCLNRTSTIAFALGSGLGRRRWPVERSNAWVLEDKCVTNGSASSTRACSRPHAYFRLQEASLENSENRL